jgi:hypothetical protein
MALQMNVSKKTSCAFNTFIQSLPLAWKEAKIITLPQLGKDPKFHQNLRLIILLSTTDKLFEKRSLRTIQNYTEEKNLLTASQCGFRADHRMTLQCMRLGRITSP